MGLLDGKAAIVTGSARGIGRATAELFASEGAKVLINDLDADVAEQTAGEIDGETAVYAGDLTKTGAADELVAAAVDAFGAVDIVRQQRRLHLGRRRPQDDRRAVPGDARHPHGRPLPGRPRARPALARGRQGRARRRQGGLPQADQHLLDLGDDGQRRPGQLLGREDGRRRPDQNPRQGVGPVQDQRQRGRLRLRRHPPHRRQGGGRRDDRPGGEKIELGIPEQMRAMASAIIPLGRPATPEEASGPVLFLASPLANYVHGQVLNVTGGMFGGMYT